MCGKQTELCKSSVHQRTGSRCYLAQGLIIKQKEEFKDSSPTFLDLFKGFHCSSKTGFDEPVKEAIAQIKAILDEPVEEGQQLKTPTKALIQVIPSSKKFLHNAGIEPTATKRSEKVATTAHVQELQAELQVSRQDSAIPQANYEALEEKSVEAKKEIEKLKKGNEETHALLRRF